MAKRKARAVSAPVTLLEISEIPNEVTNAEDSVNELETTPTEIVSTESSENENTTADSENTAATDSTTDEESEDTSSTEANGDGESEEPDLSENQEDPKEPIETPEEPVEDDDGSGDPDGGTSEEKPTEGDPEDPEEPTEPTDPEEPTDPVDPVEPPPEEPKAFQLNLATVKSQFGDLPTYWAIELIKRYFSAPPAIYIPDVVDNPDFKIMVQQVKFFGNGLRPIYNSKNMITFTTMLEGASEATILEDMKKQQPALLSLLPWYDPNAEIDK
ncbi:virion structural protein [Pseudomonas phage 14Ps5-6]|nr:virion structural protein [Pseudomonas phage 6B]WRQ07102.1 virion structural protein [Pseudomonas phage 14Ps5-6]